MAVTWKGLNTYLYCFLFDFGFRQEVVDVGLSIDFYSIVNGSRISDPRYRQPRSSSASRKGERMVPLPSYYYSSMHDERMPTRALCAWLSDDAGPCLRPRFIDRIQGSSSKRSLMGA